MEVRSVSGLSYSRLVGVANDGISKPASRGVVYNNNAYFWKGPSSSTTADGIWCVSNVVGTVDLTNNFENAFNLIPVTTMDAAGDTWDSGGGDPVGIAALKPSENYLNKDLLVVSFRASGHLYAFDLANPTGGPETMFGATNLWPAGHNEYRAQLGKAGSYIFMMDGTTDADRTLRRLNMIPEPGSMLTVAGILFWITRRK